MGTKILNTSDRAGVITDSVHQLVDEGKVFFVSHTFTEVTNEATVYLRHVSGDFEHLHSLLDIDTTGEWQFISYSGTTYTAPGTPLTAINRRSDSTNTLSANFYHTPTIDELGTPRLQFRFGSGTNPAKAQTGQFGEKFESIFAPGTDVLIALTNDSGSTQYISSVFNVYELPLEPTE